MSNCLQYIVYILIRLQTLKPNFSKRTFRHLSLLFPKYLQKYPSNWPEIWNTTLSYTEVYFVGSFLYYLHFGQFSDFGYFLHFRNHQNHFFFYKVTFSFQHNVICLSNNLFAIFFTNSMLHNIVIREMLIIPFSSTKNMHKFQLFI